MTGDALFPNPLTVEQRITASLARDGSWKRNQHVRQVLADALADMTPTQCDDITDAIHWALVNGDQVDHCAIGKVVSDCVLTHLQKAHS